ncbi:pyruvate kinase [Candidatus Uhrbacteria bacterium RIFOXYB12_FULL_58_10]|uniref:Pyruvate kinase n=1 Tax=Candidatus Uhrbacteria bacterium RIFOXYB2_FULL_57_15 TaxID=1802422 RepID=A0A1F7W6E6_9BACT|nr:MAG: pyruvate kinase [Candidatus Uhrbacteria bacterium RIFOXYB12_FULL_58_10]OGL98340.1 MAG: pyruvate kinase [Candidatus Uhrbacteria bacterium RIFOXYB2_FULL_57_15]OGM00203.1 MAG: pyruvate kinase [Candidatus Uhrbacteria bacterium RIFOXYC12_FULL_57_11]
MTRTKIICTIGPTSATPAILSSMIRSGMNVARLNFSHGTHAGHAKLYRMVRAAARKAGEPVAILGDLQGPKIRVGTLPEQGVELKVGETVTLPVTYAALYKDAREGDRILIDDGLIEAAYVKGVSGKITVKVMNGGKVTSHKGMNFPDSTLRIASLTAKDREDVKFAVKLGVDWMALSFVTSPKDVIVLRRLIGKAPVRIIVKIEKHEAIDRFDEILAVTDAVMVARGDLGVETPAEDVPLRQKEIIEKCRLAGKPVVVATQMLDSMIRNPRPTRAEVSDVANAVCDHTDAVMLSGESASGKYPRQAVAMMARILTETEASTFDDVPMDEHLIESQVSDVSHALKMLAAGNHIDGVIASARFAPWSEMLMVSRPEVTLFLACPNEIVARQNAIRWGIRPFTLNAKTSKEFSAKAVQELKKRKWTKKGMRLAVVIGGEHGAGFDIVDVG